MSAGDLFYNGTVKKILLFCIVLFLAACSEGIRGSDLGTVLSVIEEKDPEVSILKEENGEGFSCDAVSDSLEKEEYRFTFLTTEKERILEASLTAKGRVDRDFLMDVCRSILAQQKYRERIIGDLDTVVRNEAGGKLVYDDGRIRITADMTVSNTEIVFSVSRKNP